MGVCAGEPEEGEGDGRQGAAAVCARGKELLADLVDCKEHDSISRNGAQQAGCHALIQPTDATCNGSPGQREQQNKTMFSLQRRSFCIQRSGSAEV